MTRRAGETATAAAATAVDGQGDPVALFPVGRARGRHSGGLDIFMGLPYALPPVGERRWRPPAPMPRWEGVRDATSPGRACAQPARRQDSIYAGSIGETGEDCLNLNVWAPAGAQGLPVFVWIHGGSFVWGAGSEPLYDGAELARRGAVVVTINYRLGVFGYLAHPQLSAESAAGISGNYGLLDQIAALEWVRDNIAAVGGDPANVTVAGESAGALSVLYLMASPAARGLFVRAIAQSAYMISTPALKERRHGQEPAEAAGARLAATLGADGIAGLRAMEAGKLADAALRAGFAAGGTVDGVVLPRQLVEIFEAGEQARVPLLAGFNSGEIRSLLFLVPPLPTTADAYEAEIRRRYGDLADAFLALYPSRDVEESALAAVRDALYGWTALKLAAAQGAAGLACHLYYFDHTYPAATAAGLDGFHAAELPYLFGTPTKTPPLWPPVPATSTEAVLSRAVGDYWMSFAADGAPRAAGAPDWPDHDADGAIMRFAGTPRLVRDLLPGMYAFNDAVVRRRRAAGDVPWNWNCGVAAPLAAEET